MFIVKSLEKNKAKGMLIQAAKATKLESVPLDK